MRKAGSATPRIDASEVTASKANPRAHAGLATRHRRHEEGGQRDAEDRSSRHDRVEGEPFREVDRQC
jgi:hypothetical protein